MPQIVVVRRRHGNAGIVRNIVSGAVGGLVAGYRAVVPGAAPTPATGGPVPVPMVTTAPATAQPASPPLNPAPTSVQQAPAPAAPATKTFTEAEVDDMLEEIEDMIIRRVTDPDLSPDSRKLVTDLLSEFNRTFRGE